MSELIIMLLVSWFLLLECCPNGW